LSISWPSRTCPPWTWKDEDEYAQARRLGIVSDDDHTAVNAAREQVLAMTDNREGPFAPAAGPADWRPDPSWPPQTLPADAMTVGLPST
jgi:hypothetical protein